MKQSQIRAALEGHIYSFAAAEGLAVSWEGVDFEPVTGQSYLRVYVMPATSDSSDLAGEHRLYRGVLQADVVMPARTVDKEGNPQRGMGSIERLAGQVIAHCPKDKRLGFTGGFVQLTSVMSMGPKLVNGGLVTLPLSAYYRMDTV